MTGADCAPRPATDCDFRVVCQSPLLGLLCVFVHDVVIDCSQLRAYLTLIFPFVKKFVKKIHPIPLPEFQNKMARDNKN
jgi:hypothetical protein